MTRDKLLAALVPAGQTVDQNSGTLSGRVTLRSGRRVFLIGVSDRSALGVEAALRLSHDVLHWLEGDAGPILVLVDSNSQRMSKRDELLGLNEFLAHLAKCLMFADLLGHPTVGILYGHSAAGAFLATALATRTLVAVPGADPAVMDLPSMARVTKLPIDTLVEKARSTPVFAPGLENLSLMGAVHEVWQDPDSWADKLDALLAALPDSRDQRDAVGKRRTGRLKAADIAQRVYDLACQAP